MILIADSGGTKTSWRLVDQAENISQARTKGFNPYHHKIEILEQEIEQVLMPQLQHDTISRIYYYGAGCSDNENIDAIAAVLINFFPGAHIEINHDLLAAARALCGNEPGIACILGTGANSCYFDGHKIISNEPSLGYILGDEGSGAYLGKQLLIAFIRKELPPHIISRLEERFQLSKDVILKEVYQGEAAARFMASFSKFIFQNLKEPELYHLVYEALGLFFKKNIMRYQQYEEVPIHFTGSVAFYYSNIIRQVAADLKVYVKNIIEDPIAGLTLYHIKELKK